MVATGLLAFGLWVHHMFATGLPRLGYAFYTSASMTVAIPAGIQIYCWIATMWDGRPRFTTPLLYVVGFIIVFVVGGMTGVFLAAVPLDLQLHDTYFVVAHFHYVLIGGAVFPLLGAVVYWFPKLTGRMMSEALGKWTFWVQFIGFEITFMPMHWIGLMGMPRRVYTYPEGLGWDLSNLISSIGAFILAGGVLMFVANAVISLRAGRIAGPNPWDAPGLEWAAQSPPPNYNFPHIPVVDGRTPLWENRAELPVTAGLRVDDKELLLTTVIDAKPDVREPSALPSPWPFITALALTTLFVCSIFSPWAVLIGTLPVGAATAAWFWPKDRQVTPEPVIH
jgi:heme/copper-type cytochrome/quinol oxidase subunit 1